MSDSLAPNILMVTEDDAEFSHAQYIFSKYHFSNSILRLRRPLDLVRHLGEIGTIGKIPGGKLPELIIYSAAESAIGQFSSMMDYTKAQIKDIPLVVVAETIEAEKLLRGLQLQSTYVIGKPLGFFKLLEAMQKLGMYWTVKRSPG